MIMHPTSDKLYGSGRAVAPLQMPAVASLKPKRRFKVLERAVIDPVEVAIPAPVSAERPPSPRLKRSGEPQQIWKQPPATGRPVPSKSLSAQQLVEWLARSPFANPPLRHSH